MNPTVAKWVFRLVTIFAPVVVAALLALQSQLDIGGEIEWRPIVSSLIGAVVVAMAHVIRVAQEASEGESEP